MRPVFHSVLTAVFLAMAGVADAGPFEDGQAAYDRHDYAAALQDWRPLADQGDVRAQVSLGMMYYNGQISPQDYAQALAWFRKAAEQGLAEAQYNLGVMYDEGRGAPQDFVLAYLWYNLTASVAERGPSEDIVKTREWAAKNRDLVAAKMTPTQIAQAQYALGWAYANGQGVPQDYEKAIAWYRKAAEQGDASAQNNLGVMYDEGNSVPQDYAQAVAWYRKAANQGFAIAQVSIGKMYYNGQGVPQNYAQAVAWYRKAAEQGDADGQYGLGLAHALGQGVPQDYMLAYMWFNLAASHAKDAEIRNMAAKFRDKMASTMTPAQIAEAQRMAR